MSEMRWHECSAKMINVLRDGFTLLYVPSSLHLAVEQHKFAFGDWAGGAAVPRGARGRAPQQLPRRPDPQAAGVTETAVRTGCMALSHVGAAGDDDGLAPP